MTSFDSSSPSDIDKISLSGIDLGSYSASSMNSSIEIDPLDVMTFSSCFIWSFNPQYFHGLKGMGITSAFLKAEMVSALANRALRIIVTFLIEVVFKPTVLTGPNFVFILSLPDFELPVWETNVELSEEGLIWADGLGKVCFLSHLMRGSFLRTYLAL
ncbi:hypothetical protein Tco_0728447 [Tanacetum coccineum]|uniref:Uncharacterized protein n=1 Tax=Tanacetum coccineum TaxID=301880 RepID=A0ABQ4YM93_9ASTR